MAKLPHLGDPFPSLTVKTTQGPMVLPDDFAGKWFVFFSHPADFMPVCTTEYVAFQKRYDEFRQLNTELIGISLDQVYAHIKWLDWIRDNLEVEITFPIIADDYGGISTMLGIIHPAKGTNTVRAVIIVDGTGTVRAMMYYPHELGRNLDEILRMIQGLQIVDEEQVSLPANWPSNELIDDHVIIPPPTDVLTAKGRTEEYEGYDWWFCHRKL